MREHPFTHSPLSAFLDPSLDPDINFAQRPYDDSETWPSEICDGGRVGWRRFEVGEDGWLEVSYPEIRWDQLRSDHGWASLQYQSILRTTINIPAVPNQPRTSVRIDVTQGVEYAFVPYPVPTDLTEPISWYNADIYAFSDTPTGLRGTTNKTSNFARSLSLTPGKYVILLKALYEIRMFGDPGSSPPTIRIKVAAEVDEVGDFQILEGLEEVPDVVDGWFMGDWISVGFRVPSEAQDIEIIGVELPASFGQSINLTLPGSAKILKGQIRPIALRVGQTKALPGYVQSLAIKLTIKIHGSGKGEEKQAIWHPTFNHIRTDDKDRIAPFKITFASPSITSGVPAAVSHAMILPPPQWPTNKTSSSASPVALASDPGIIHPQPPSTPSASTQQAAHSANAAVPLSPVLLVLHGAGVDITLPEYIAAVPSIPEYWAVLPTGRNEWGEDWHGGSMLDVWAARDAFSLIIRRIGMVVSDQTIMMSRMMGHSNGGQGAWHLAARYPDRVRGVVAASGWLTIQDYVPYTEINSRHYADPSLMGILSSSLSSYNNDLYLSNLANIPILVVHGSEDDNVPPRHSRSYVNIISSWAGQQDGGPARLLEVPKKGHWWDDVLRSDQVIEFIKDLPHKKSWDEQRKVGFTLTTANPQESGGRAGVRIVELDIPGRIGRLDVNARQWKDSDPAKPLDLRGTNVKRIELVSQQSGKLQTFRKSSSGIGWIQEDVPIMGPLTLPRAYGPIIRILSTAGPMTIICPDSPRLRDIAKKIAHDLYLYHRLDSDIIGDREGLMRVAKDELGQGNLVILGRPDENLYTNWMIRQGKLPLRFPTKGVMLVNDKVVYDRGAVGLITLHPHTTSSRSLAMLIAGNDDLGLELAARLSPIRTGVPIPDWAIVGPQARWKGAGGFIGAGFWDGHWGWNEAMSWMDR
uniref:Peptidase S9 prolyl oligopeptidase catalytic domain-containing protein n=1 Tax=Kwoniella dejecticola CBS 10117 TaxID=1296121 RepID=A0A1A6A5B6_9TREE|nr:uncharacterized protein I303_04583 [Kwoniella dejecticola CBS 10117]OBR85250.1 hypothetical protein I303_04583 [Kwoniella dejecticola CBS 10117]